MFQRLFENVWEGEEQPEAELGRKTEDGMDVKKGDRCCTVGVKGVCDRRHAPSTAKVIRVHSCQDCSGTGVEVKMFFTLEKEEPGQVPGGLLEQGPWRLLFRL